MGVGVRVQRGAGVVKGSIQRSALRSRPQRWGGGSLLTSGEIRGIWAGGGMSRALKINLNPKPSYQSDGEIPGSIGRECAFQVARQRAEAAAHRKAAEGRGPGGMGPDAAAEETSGAGLLADGDQPGFGAGAALLDALPDRQRHWETSCRTAQADCFGGADGDGHSRHHLLFPDPTALEGGAAIDRGVAREGAAAYLAAPGVFL